MAHLTVPALWRITKYEFVKGTLEVRPETVFWCPNKATQGKEINVVITDITDTKKTKKGAAAALLMFKTNSEAGDVSFQFDTEEDRDAVFSLVDDLVSGVVITLDDGSAMTKGELKEIKAKEYVRLYNTEGWGDAPEHIACHIMRVVLTTNGHDNNRSARLVCKRWKKVHDDVVEHLKPTLWFEGAAAAALDPDPDAPQAASRGDSGSSRNGNDNAANGDATNGDASPPHEVSPLFLAALPTSVSVVQLFPKLVTIDFSALDVRRVVSDFTATTLGGSGLRLTSLNLAHCVRVTYAGVQALLPLAGSLKVLHLTGCFRVGDEGVPFLCQLTGLKQLSLGETSKITDAGLVELGQSTALAASLTELDLHECREVTSEGVAALTGLTALQTLDCNYMRYLAEEGIAALGTMPALTTLRLCGSKGVSAGEQGLRTLVTASTSLGALDFDWSPKMGEPEAFVLAQASGALAALSLRGCGAMTDAAMTHLGQLPALTSLNLKWCPQVMDEGLQALAQCAGTLTDLCLKGCERVTDTGVSSLANIYALQKLDISGLSLMNGHGIGALTSLENLTELDVSLNRRLNSEGMEAIGTVTNITTLRIDHTTAVNPENISLLGNMNLRTLSLADCPLMQDDCAEEITVFKDTLTNLDLSSSMRLTDKGVKHLSKLTNLRELSLARCSRISNMCMASLGRLKNLRTLRIGESKGVSGEGLVHLTSHLTSLQEMDISGVCTLLDDESLTKIPLYVRLIRRVAEKEKDEPPEGM